MWTRIADHAETGPFPEMLCSLHAQSSCHDASRPPTLSVRMLARSSAALGQVHGNFEEEVDLSLSFPVLFGSPPLDNFFEVRWRIADDLKVTGSSLGFMGYTPGPLTIDPC